MHPKTDIICLTHNNIRVTKRFVETLFQWTQNFRLIFIDNASTDGTVEFLKQGVSESKWEAIFLDENVGIIKARNIGASHVKNDYFINIDNDQHPRGPWLQFLHDTINKGYDVVGIEAWKLSPPGSGGKVVIHNKEEPMDYFPIRKCKSKNEQWTYVGCGGMLIKKSVYDSIGLFDELFSPAYFEDPDFCFRAIQSGYKIGWVHDCPVTHLAHQTISYQTLFNKKDQLYISWKKFKKKWNGYFPKKP